MEEVGGKTNMEQNILKRYNEIHVKLWEEVAKIFDRRADKSFEEFKTNTKLLNDFCLSDMKRKAVLNLYSKGYIAGSELSNLLANANCSACYIAQQMYYIFENSVNACMCCPIPKWRELGECNDYQVVNGRVYQLKDYIEKCIDGKKEFNLEVYTRLRMDIKRKMYNISSLEWRCEEDAKQ